MKDIFKYMGKKLSTVKPAAVGIVETKIEGYFF
jgi:hypothetical protein